MASNCLANKKITIILSLFLIFVVCFCWILFVTIGFHTALLIMLIMYTYHLHHRNGSFPANIHPQSFIFSLFFWVKLTSSYTIPFSLEWTDFVLWNDRSSWCFCGRTLSSRGGNIKAHSKDAREIKFSLFVLLCFSFNGYKVKCRIFHQCDCVYIHYLGICLYGFNVFVYFLFKFGHCTPFKLGGRVSFFSAISG